MQHDVKQEGSLPWSPLLWHEALVSCQPRGLYINTYPGLGEIHGHCNLEPMHTHSRQGWLVGRFLSTEGYQSKPERTQSQLHVSKAFPVCPTVISTYGRTLGQC